jgi:hypothetical protein
MTILEIEAQHTWDFAHGVWLAKTGHNLAACHNADQESGWNWYGEDCYLRCMAMDVRYEPAIESDTEWIRSGC